EDEPLVRNMVVRILFEQGYRVLEAGNGEEALRVVDSHAGESIDLLLTDLVMPQMGGKDLAQRLKRSGVSVVVMDACYSAKTANKYDKWTGMVSALVRVGIPAVVGMQYAFSDAAAKAFWPDFYEAVAAGLTLDEAVSAGRLAIMDLEPEPSEENPQEMLTAQNDFGFPALYMRSEDGLLFPELTNDSSLAGHREQLSRRHGSLPPAPGKTGPVGPPPGPDARLSGEVPPELALLNHLASKSPGGDFVYVYYASKSPTAPMPPPAKPTRPSDS
ncbi:MAG: CHAT domain-containing protein, partial [Bacteroidetes bacterium]|nr:CHAT domain-containing protein [Bacteroidota bacterium]